MTPEEVQKHTKILYYITVISDYLLILISLIWGLGFGFGFDAGFHFFGEQTKQCRGIISIVLALLYLLIEYPWFIVSSYAQNWLLLSNRVEAKISKKIISVIKSIIYTIITIYMYISGGLYNGI